jgi:hypothetical protein
LFRDREILIKKQLLGSEYYRQQVTGIDRDRSVAIAFSFTSFTRSIQLRSNRKKYSIAQLLAPAENNWLKSEITSYLLRAASGVEN